LSSKQYSYTVHRFTNQQVIATPSAVIDQVRALVGMVVIKRKRKASKAKKSPLAAVWAATEKLLKDR